MELRSKSQREAVGPDVADRDLSGEAVIRLAHDPSPPVLSPVRLQTTPVLSDSNTDDAEQRQEHAHTTPESGTLTQHTCMNEMLYRWRFNFHKVVRQQNSGVVEDFILPYSAVHLRIQKWKNYWNRSTFAKVIHQRITAYFFDPPCML